MAAVMPLQARGGHDFELMALRLQQEEVLKALDSLAAQRLCAELAAEEGIEVQGVTDAVVEEVVMLELQLQEGHILAQSMEASGRVAQVIADQETWDQAVRTHDRRFAHELSRVGEHEWIENGDNIQQPFVPPGPRPADLDADPGLAAGLVAAAAAPAAAVAAAAGPAAPAAAVAAPAAAAAAPAAAMAAPAVPAALAAAVAGAAAPAAVAGAAAPAAVAGAAAPAARSAAAAAPAAAAGAAAAARAVAAAATLAAPAAASAGPAASNSGPTSNQGASSSSQNCPICFETMPERDTLCAGGGADAASTSARPAGCGHYYCTDCLRHYVRDHVKDRKYPIRCPEPQCTWLFSRINVGTLLAEYSEELQVYARLEVQHVVGQDHVYCPFKDCSAFLVRPEQAQRDVPSTCPECNRDFCLTCRITGWHEGFTCSAFQALPAHQRTKEDAEALTLSARKKWKQCPQCGHGVERTEGCNHVQCRCGTGFCYQCGLRYKSKNPSANNVHGTPSCKCELFTVPEERDVQQEEWDVQQGEWDVQEEESDEEDWIVPPPPPPPVFVHMPLPVVAMRAEPRVLRGGRKVSHTRCRNSSSIYGCRFGPECFFWHDEDDL